MKKFITILLAAASLFAVSCQQKEEAYEWGPKDDANCYGVYFPAQTLPSVQDPTQAPEAQITLKRLNSNGAITVPIELKSNENVFSVGQAQFADGQDETTVTLSFPSAEDGVNYTCELRITDPAYASYYKDVNTTFKYKVMRVSWLYLGVENGKAVAVSDPAKAAKITWVQNWWGEVHTGTIKFYEVNGMRTCSTITEDVDGFWGTGNELNFKWDSASNNIYFEPQYVDAYDASNDIYMYDYYGYYNFLNSNYAGSWPDALSFFSQNPTITCSYYEDGQINLYVHYFYVMGLGGWSIQDFDVIGYVEGLSEAE